MITAAELGALRATAEQILTDTCRIDRTTSVDDDAGGGINTTAPVATVACAVSARDLQPSEIAAGAGLVGEMGWQVDMPAETDVRAGDRVVVTSQGDRALEVVGVAGPLTREILRRVQCQAVS